MINLLPHPDEQFSPFLYYFFYSKIPFSHNWNGSTPLMWAANIVLNGLKSVDAIWLLLDKGANIHHKANNGATALHCVENCQKSQYS